MQRLPSATTKPVQDETGSAAAAPEIGRSPAILRRALWVFVVAVLVFALAASLLPTAAFRSVFEEEGLVEWLTLAAWLVVAAVFARQAWLGRGGIVAWLAVPASIAAALREADLHKTLTGYSVLKVSFYRSADFALSQKLIAGAVVLLVAVALLALVVLAVRSLLRNGLRYRPLQVLGVALLLLVVSKVFDRTPATLLEDFGIGLPEWVLRWLQAFEEGFELLLPGAFLAAYLAARAAPGRIEARRRSTVVH